MKVGETARERRWADVEAGGRGGAAATDHLVACEQPLLLLLLDLLLYTVLFTPHTTLLLLGEKIEEESVLKINPGPALKFLVDFRGGEWSWRII